ncbi:MAG TPA: flagellar motor switch protein FliG, partial [Ignavibacteriaceae bacterium]|nr:flagellar motor switch protein FliG [Ignavibacteriaceae bacterium]
MPIEKDPKKIELTGLQKASLLMIALKIETAAEVFKYLDPTIIETISTEITKIKNIPSQKIDSILEEFYEMIIAREYVIEGGVEYAEALLEKSFGKPKAVEIIDKVKSITTLRGFDVLKKADSMQLINFLNKEHPQTIALILSHLNPTQTAGVLKELPAALRDDVVYRIATLGKISPQTLTQIEKVVDDLAGVSMSQSLSTIGGTKSLAVVLNKSALSLSRDILNKLSEKDPNVATEVKRLMFMFEDIINIQDKDIQRIMRDLDRKDLALSLKIADDKLK